MTMTRRICAATVAAGVTAAVVPAAAQAATIAPLTRCARYVPALAGHRYIPITGRGFTPGGAVRLSYAGGDLAGTTTVDGTGAIGTDVLGPTSFIDPRAGDLRTYRLTATDQTHRSITARATVQMVRVDVAIPARAKPQQVVAYRLYGFPSKPIYAHYYFGGRRQASVAMGHPTGSCGLLRRRMRYIPAKVRYGTWNVYFTSHRTFSQAMARRRDFVFMVKITVSRAYQSLREAPPASGAAAAAAAAGLAR